MFWGELYPVNKNVSGISSRNAFRLEEKNTLSRLGKQIFYPVQQWIESVGSKKDQNRDNGNEKKHQHNECIENEIVLKKAFFFVCSSARFRIAFQVGKLIPSSGGGPVGWLQSQCGIPARVRLLLPARASLRVPGLACPLPGRAVECPPYKPSGFPGL